MRIRKVVIVIVCTFLVSMSLYFVGSSHTKRAVTASSYRKGRSYTLFVHQRQKINFVKKTNKVKWKSKNKKIATVNKNGIVTAKKVGKVRIEGIYKHIIYHYTVYVKSRKISKIDCVGDSITYGTGVRLTRSTDAYPVMLKHAFNYNVIVNNYGMPSYTLQNEGNLPYRSTGYIQRVKSDRPDVIIIMLGTNDCKPINWNKDRYIKEYTALIKQFKGISSHPDIYIMIPPALALSHSKKKTSISVDNINKLPGIITNIGKKTHVHVIDQYHVIKGHMNYYYDKIHPNKLGNEKMVNKIVSALSKEYIIKEKKTKK